MMFDTPTISHLPPTPPGSPNPPSPSSPRPSLAAAGVVRAELAQQANEVCQLVAKANRAPNGLHADELRRLLSDINSLHLLAQQLSSSSSSSSTSSSTSSSSTSPSRGIAKKKPVHHASVLSRPLTTAFASSPSSSSSSPAWCAASSPPVPTTTTTTTSSAAAAVRACHTPIRPRGHALPMAATTAATGGSSSCLSPEIGAGPRACANCGTSSTVQWRCGADGKPSLCNACGLRYRYNLKKKALYEDIAVVRAMTQRSPPFAQHNQQHTHSLPSCSAFASPSSSASASPSASRSPSPPPPSLAPAATAASTAGCPPRPAPAPSTTTAAASAPADAGSEARRSNIYSLLN